MSPDNPPNRFIYFFADGHAEGGNELRHLVGDVKTGKYGHVLAQ